MLSNDMLHYGYFDDPSVAPETLSFSDVEHAQIKYAERLLSHLADKSLPVLDIGCGIGGIANLLHRSGFEVEVLTPNVGQISYIQKRYPHLVAHKSKFEEFKAGRKYGSLLNAESFQYMDPQKAFDKAGSIIAPGGKWVICDYFSILPSADRLLKKRLEDLEEMAAENGWTIEYCEDITLHVMPTLSFANMYVTRIVNPILVYLEHKLMIKLAWLHHLTSEIREKLSGKLYKEFSKLNTDTFIAEKRYMLIVLSKNG